MAKYRVTFPNDEPAYEVEADRMEQNGNGVRLFRKDADGVEQQVAYFYSGSFKGAYEVQPETG